MSCHHLLCDIKVCLGWAAVTSGPSPLLARTSSPCNETSDFPTGQISQVSDQLCPLRSVLKEKCTTSTTDKLLTTRSLCPGNYLPCWERVSPSHRVSPSPRRYLWVMRWDKMLVNHKFSCADATLRRLCPRALSCRKGSPACPKKAVVRSLISEDRSQAW